MASEFGFYHPDRGYWQSVGGEADQLLQSDPDGTVNVPLKPGPDYEWSSEEWIHVSPIVDLVEYAAQKRWEKEVGGITLNGAMIDTSRDSQAMINGAFNWAKEHPTETVHFKAASGWVEFDAETMIAIATAVGSHVQQCFATEASVAAGMITTTAEIDAAFA